MTTELLVVIFIVSLAVAAVSARMIFEKRNNIGGRNNEEAPGGWFGSE